MGKFDKYFNDFNPPEDTGGTGNKIPLTSEDLQAVEKRINAYINESISRLDSKLDSIKNTETKNTETETNNTVDNTDETKGE